MNLDCNSLLDYFRQRQAAVLQLARDLVERESPSGDADGSRAVAARVGEAVWDLPAPVTFERLENELGTHIRVRAFSECAARDGTLLLLGHSDTVHPRGTLATRPWRITDEGRIYGPGIFDMKANIALALETLRALMTLGLKPRREVVALFTCDEEIGSPQGRIVVEEEARQARHCLVLEPSAPGGKAKTGRKGTGLFEIHAHGVPAHAGLEPEKGANAIAELARHIEGLHALTDYALGTTVNLCTMSGGTTSNVIPEHAQAEVDVRFKQMSEAARVERAVRSLHATDSRVRLEIRGDINRPPLERTPQVVALYEQARELAASFGYELGEAQVGGGSDGNFVGALGVPVLDGLGLAGDGAHAVHEHIMAGDIPRRGTLLAALLTTLA